MPGNPPPTFAKPPPPPGPPMSYNGIANLRPTSYFVSVLTCLYCGRTPTGDYDTCDYCGAPVRRGQRIDVTTTADKGPRYT